MRVNVSYVASVQVIVDLDTGEVDRVVVLDETVRPDRDEVAEDADEYRPVSGEVKARAYEIAEGDVEWPTWDWGW